MPDIAVLVILFTHWPRWYSLPEERGIAVYISLGWLVTILIIFGFALLNPLQINSSPLQQQLALTAKCLLVCIFWLIVSIGRLAKLRFFSREDIEGSGLTLGSEQAHILQAILTNTCDPACLPGLFGLDPVYASRTEWRPRWSSHTVFLRSRFFHV